jgi:sugar phosphate permease
MPPATALLLNSVHGHLAGTASGVFNTSRQVGGALAVAVFGGLLADPATFMSGVRSSLLIAAAVVLVAGVAALRLKPTRAGRGLTWRPGRPPRKTFQSKRTNEGEQP